MSKKGDDTRLFFDVLKPGEESNMVTYMLDRSKIKTLPQILDVLEWVLGDMNLEKGMAEELFLSSPISKYYVKYVHEQQDTDESDSQSKP